MRLFYALGGGLGHMTRALAFIRQQAFSKEEVIILTSGMFPGYLPGEYPCLIPPPELEGNLSGLQHWLSSIIEEYQVREVYLDAFPLGLLGEWKDFLSDSGLKFFYLARILRWQNYPGNAIQSPITFTHTYILEPLEEEHRRFIQQYSTTSSEYQLIYPPETFQLDAKGQSLIQQLRAIPQPVWLLVHAGPENEIRMLVEFAREAATLEKVRPYFQLLSPWSRGMGQGVSHASLYPAAGLFSGVARVVSAAGFNMVHQCLQLGLKPLLLPFPRKFDDQFLRARFFRRGNLGPR